MGEKKLDPDAVDADALDLSDTPSEVVD